MFGGLVGLIANIGLGSIATALKDAFRDRQNAETEQARIAADERIKALEAQRAVLVAEAGSRINALLRAAFAVPVAIYLGKLILWDKAFGLGATDDLSLNLWGYVYMVVGFYFVSSMWSGRR